MPRILIVDDEENQRRSLSLGLASEGFECVEADGAESALEVLGRVPRIELAIVDLMMPGVSGLELAKRIRWSFPCVRVMIASAYHLSARQLQRSECGAIGFIPKPYHLPELSALLRAKTRPATLQT